MPAQFLIQAAAFAQGGAAIVRGAAHDQHELALALVGVGIHARFDRVQAVAEHGLEELGQLPCQDRLALGSEDGDEIGKGFLDAVSGFIEDHRPGFGGQALQAFTAGGAAGGQETFEAEAVAGDAGHRQRRDRRAGSGHRTDRESRGAHLTHQPVAGVRDQGRARIRHQRQRFAAFQALDQLPGDVGLVVVVHRHQRPFQAEGR